MRSFTDMERKLKSTLQELLTARDFCLQFGGDILTSSAWQRAERILKTPFQPVEFKEVGFCHACEKEIKVGEIGHFDDETGIFFCGECV